MKNPKAFDLPLLYSKILCFEDYGDASELDMEEAMCRRLMKLGLSESLVPKLKSHFGSLLLRKSQRLQPLRLFEQGDLHVEICSGSGEWLSQQAGSRRSVSNYFLKAMF